MEYTYEITPAPMREQKPRPSVWQKTALYMLSLSVAVNVVQTACIGRLGTVLQETEGQLRQTEAARDYAIRQLGAAALQAERDKLDRAEQAEAYEAVGAYRYIGECTITAYCPCEECCGQWADGLTATGIPAGPGIVAVDPDVIPLGSTVIIDGQRYLAADTGVTGERIDICAASHQAAEAFGVRMEKVWVAASQ